MIEKEGILIKGIGGFYYVDCDGITYECKARGLFRKQGISPYAGDKVKITVQENGYSSLDSILPRKNSIVRPPMANLDNLIIVASVCAPQPNTIIIDKMIATAVNKDITPILVITKSDLGSAKQLYDIYTHSGIKTICTTKFSNDGLDEIRKLLPNKFTAFIGNSGVGKSTLINSLFPNLDLDTGDISKKLGRGRHTTRQVELFKVNGGYVADTPGFSTVDIEHYEMIEKEQIKFCFSDFADYIDNCQFTSCSHTCEKGCAVLQAVKENKIERSRHESYVAMYNEIKDIKDWQRKRNSI